MIGTEDRTNSNRRIGASGLPGPYELPRKFALPPSSSLVLWKPLFNLPSKSKSGVLIQPSGIPPFLVCANNVQTSVASCINLIKIRNNNKRAR